MRFSLGNTASTVAAARSTIKKFVKDNLKIHFDFKSSRAKTLEFVGTGSAEFDAIGDKIVTTFNPATELTNGDTSFSIMLWVYGYRSGSSHAYLVGDNDFTNRFYIRLDAGDTNIKFGASGFNFATTGGGWKANDWNHIACVYDTNANLAYIYIDGDLKRSYAASSSTAYTNQNIEFLEQISSTSIIGKMKNVGIWKRPLSASEVQNIMYKTHSDLKGSELDHLIRWWALETNSNETIESESSTDTSISYNTDNYGNNAPRKPRGFDNAPTAQADLIGSGSAVFDASSNEYIRCGVSGLSSLSLGTAACWFKISGDSGAHMALFSINDESGSGDFATLRLIRGSSTSYTISARVHNEGSSLLYPTNSTNVMDDKWHHIVWVVGSSSNKIYLDGAKLTLSYSEGSQSSSTQKFFSDVADADVFAIGSTKGTNPANEFEGNIAQVGVWSVALSQEEIQSIKEKTYSELTTSEKTNLVSWWGLDEETATDGTAGIGGVKDSHGTNHGTLA